MIRPVLKWENKIQRKPKTVQGPEGTSPAGRAEPCVEELRSERVAWLQVPLQPVVGSDIFGWQAWSLGNFWVVLT